MLEFVTQDTFECPYCKSDLALCSKDAIYCWKFCLNCNKRFEIAYFTPKEKKDDKSTGEKLN